MFVFNKHYFTETIVQQTKGMSCRDVAELCDLSPATISRIKNGATPSLVTVMKLCMGLWKDPRNYFSYSPDDKEQQMRLL